MGMFDTVSNAAKAVGTPMDTASSLLAGNMGPAGANDASKGQAEFLRGYNLDVNTTDEESAGQAPNLVNALNSYPVIEFIHFGWVHTSHSNFFTHDELSGTDMTAAGNKKITPTDRPRGIQFRSALEREALLIWLFMRCTQLVLAQKEEDSKMGGVGAALDVASSMFGGNKPAGGMTQSSELTSYMQKAADAITPVLNKQIIYKDIHKAGVDLNQAWYDYRALLDKIIAEKPEAGKGGGIAGDLMSQASALPSTLTDPTAGPGSRHGGVTDTLSSIVSLTQGIVFKAQDVKAKLYAYAARHWEGQLRDSSNEMTYRAIHQTMDPFFQVWFEPGPPPKPADQWGGPDSVLSQDSGFDGFGSQARKLGQDVLAKQAAAQKKIQDEGNKVKSFFEPTPEAGPPPGTEALGMSFNDPPKHKGDKSLVPMAMGKLTFTAFTTVLGLPSLGFAETIVGGVLGVVLEFTKATYQTLLVRKPGETISEADLTESAVKDMQIADRLKTFALAHLQFLRDAQQTDVKDLMEKGLGKENNDKYNKFRDFSLKPAGLMDVGADKFEQIIEEKVKPMLEPIIAYAMKGLADTLDKARSQGVKDNCHTMEWYLGLLPMLQAQIFSDIFFPFWTHLMSAAAEMIGGPFGSAVKAILAMDKKMKGVLDTARDYAKKTEMMANTAKDQYDYLTTHQLHNKDIYEKPADAAVSVYEAGKQNARPTTSPDQGPTPDKDDPNNPFTKHPLKSRVDTGKGIEIKRADYDQMHDAKNPAIFKWDDPATRDPDAAEDGADAKTRPNAPAAGPAAPAGASTTA